jgi:hypothetical protein
VVNKQTALSGSQIHTSGSAGGQVIHLQTFDILRDSYHFKEQMSRKILQYRKLF